MTDDKLFCTACGAELTRDDKFCPVCGASTSGAINPDRRTGTRQDESSLNTTRVLILLYGIVALALGVLALAGSAMINNPDFQQAFIDAGLSGNFGDLATTAAIEACVMIASGICALASSYFISKRSSYNAAFWLCVVAACTSLVLFPLGIITLLVGLYMAYRISKARNLFN